MTSIALSDIPAFLHGGSFYQSLNLDDKSETIQIPEGCFKADTSIANIEDFQTLLKVAMFWGVDDILPILLDFCCETEPLVWKDSVHSIADSELRSDLILVYNELLHDGSPISAAIRQGRTQLVEYFSNQEGMVHDKDTVDVAVRCGRLDYLKLLHEKGFPVTTEAFSSAAAGGQLECLKYVHSVLKKRKRRDEDEDEDEEDADEDKEEQDGEDQQEDDDDDDDDDDLDIGHLTEVAAKDNHPNTLAYLLEHFNDDCGEWAAASAASNGNYECLRVLHAAGNDFDNIFDDNCASYDLDMIKFLHEEINLALPNQLVLDSVCGDVERLRYAIEHDCEYDAEELLREAVEADSAECLKYLVEELHLPIADVLTEGVDLKEKCKAYLESAGLLPVDA